MHTASNSDIKTTKALLTQFTQKKTSNCLWILKWTKTEPRYVSSLMSQLLLFWKMIVANNILLSFGFFFVFFLYVCLSCLQLHSATRQTVINKQIYNREKLPWIWYQQNEGQSHWTQQMVIRSMKPLLSTSLSFWNYFTPFHTRLVVHQKSVTY